MKARITLITGMALALVAPAAHAGTDNTALNAAPARSTEIAAMTARGDALNRLYHLGTYRTQSNAQAIRALTLRGEALNRRYGLGDYAPGVVGISDVVSSNAVARHQVGIETTGFLSDVASSDAVSRYQANRTDTPDALGRYQNNVTSGSTPSGFLSDVASSDAVSRYQANHTTDGTAVSSGGDGILQSPATDAGIALGLLLISLAGFMVARRHGPLRHA